MKIETIEHIAQKILSGLGIIRPPVDVRAIAQKQGVVVAPYDLGGSISGVLVLKNGVATIGVNSENAESRQRFTIAHELGHYVLHRQSQEMFVDENFSVYFRDENSSTGEQTREIEANAFAAALLMPKEMLMKEVEEGKYDLDKEEDVVKLAKCFSVSTMAMSYRIGNLWLRNMSSL
jgi:Zn-dependent peptidase ImmA (M78 family)